MTQKEFIFKKIEFLIKKYPTIRCRYEDDVLSSSNYIEIVPKEYCQTNEDFRIDQLNIIMDFNEVFPYSSLTFVTEGDLFEISTPCFVKEGEFYNKYTIEMPSYYFAGLQEKFISIDGSFGEVFWNKIPFNKEDYSRIFMKEECNPFTNKDDIFNVKEYIIAMAA